MRTHGTESCYSAGCRRDECRKAHSAYARERRMGKVRRVDSGPFQDVIRALTVPPYTVEELHRLTGVDRHTIENLRRCRYESVYSDTAEKLRATLPTLLPSGGDADKRQP